MAIVSDKSLIWLEIRKAAPAINKAGGNAIELLIWSQGRHLREVQRRIKFILETANLGDAEVRKREAIEEQEMLEFRKKSEVEKNVRYKAEEMEVEKMESVYIGKQQRREAEGNLICLKTEHEEQ